MSYPCPHCGIDTALAFPGPADEVVIDGKRWRVIPTGFGYDDGSQSCRLVPTEVAQDQVDWRVMALRVKHKSAGPECSCENPKPGAHAQSCPRFGMNRHSFPSMTV